MEADSCGGPSLVPRTAEPRSPRVLISIGVATVVVALLVGAGTLVCSRNVLERAYLAGAEARAQMRADSIDRSAAPQLSPAALALLETRFRKTGESLRSTCLVVVAPQGDVLVCSPHDASRAGELDHVVRSTGFAERLARCQNGESSWAGVLPDTDDEPLLGAFARSAVTGASVGFIVPRADVRQELDRMVLPWVAALGVLVLLLVAQTVWTGLQAYRSLAQRVEASDQQLRESEATLYAAIESLPVELWVCDRAGRYRVQNSASIRRHGNRLGKYAIDDGPALEGPLGGAEYHARVLGGEELEVEREYDANGARRIVHTILAPVRTDRATIGAVGVNIDVTRHRRAERELSAAHERLDLHVQNSPLAVIEWDPEYRVRRWSAGAERIFGWKSEEIVGRSWLDFGFVLPEDVEAIRAVGELLTSGAETRVVNANRNRTRDGRTIHCEWYASVLHDEDGRLSSILSLCQDVTPRKVVEELEKVQREILHAVLEGRARASVLDVVAARIEAILSGASAAVFVRDSTGRCLSLATGAHAPPVRAALDGLRPGPDETACARACSSGRTVVIDDVQGESVAPSDRALLEPLGFRALWAHPIVSAHGEVLGVAALFFREPRGPDALDRRLLEAFADLACLAIENDRARDLQETHRRVLKAMVEEAPLEATLTAIVEGLQRQRVGLCTLLLIAERRTQWRFAASSGIPFEFARGIEDSALNADTVQPRCRQLLADAGLHAIWSQLVRSTVGEVVGALLIGSSEPRGADARDVDLFEFAARLAGIAIERKRATQASREFTDRLRTLNEIDQAILGARSVQGVAEVALWRLSDQLGCGHAAVVLLDEDAYELVIVAAVSARSSGFRAGDRLPLAHVGLEWDEWKRPGHRTIADIGAVADPPRALTALRASGVRALTSVSMVSLDNTIGFVGVGFDRPDALSDEGLQLVYEVANSLAVALEGSRLHEDLARQSERRRDLSERLTVLNEIGREILQARSLDQLMRTVLALTRTATQCQRASLSLIDEDAGIVRLAAVHSEIGTRVGGGQDTVLGEFPFHDPARLRAGEVLHLVDLTKTAAKWSRELVQDGLRSLLQLPMNSGGRLVGTLNLSFSQTDAANAETIALGQGIADLLSVAVLQSRLNEALRQNAQELERRVAERTAQLASVNEELEGYVRAVTHDLRAPLRAIRGFGDALIEDLGPRLGGADKDHLERMIRAAERMDGLIEDLLELTRLAQADLHVQPLHTESVVSQALALVDAELRARGAVVTVEAPLARVVGHAPSLLQVLTNLLSNAAKFVAPGRSASIRVRTEERGVRVRVWIEDDGIGIDPAHHENVFRVFERLHGQELYPGTGIGLAIVRRAVERMRGTCGVESALGTGSRFWIELAAGDRLAGGDPEVSAAACAEAPRARPDGAPKDRAHPAS